MLKITSSFSQPAPANLQTVAIGPKKLAQGNSRDRLNHAATALHLLPEFVAQEKENADPTIQQDP